VWGAGSLLTESKQSIGCPRGSRGGRSGSQRANGNGREFSGEGGLKDEGRKSAHKKGNNPVGMGRKTWKEEFTKKRNKTEYLQKMIGPKGVGGDQNLGEQGIPEWGLRQRRALDYSTWRFSKNGCAHTDKDLDKKRFYDMEGRKLRKGGVWEPALSEGGGYSRKKHLTP